MMEAERIDNIGIQISETNLDSSCTLNDLFPPDQFEQGVLAQSTSHVVITFFYPSFPSRDNTPCYGPGMGSVLIEPWMSQVRSSYARAASP